MTTYEVNRSTTNTLTSTTADTITLTQLWGSVRVTNQHTSNWLYATPGGETAVAEADGTVAIPPGQSRTFKAERAEGTNTVVVGVVGNGNVYTVEGMQGTLDEALDDLTAEVDTLVLDEDDFASDSTTRAPSQQSTAAYIEAVAAPLTAAVKPRVTLGLPLPLSEFQDTGTATLDRVVYQPLPVPHPVAVDQLGIYISTAEATSVARLGLYAPAADGTPGALLAEASSTVDASTTGGKTVNLASPANLTHGLVYFAMVFQGVASAVRFRRRTYPGGIAWPIGLPAQLAQTFSQDGLAYVQNSVSGALPVNATIVGGGGTPASLPVCWVRVSALL